MVKMFVIKNEIGWNVMKTDLLILYFNVRYYHSQIYTYYFIACALIYKCFFFYCITSYKKKTKTVL